MLEFDSAVLALIIFVINLGLLYWLSLQISRHLQIVVYGITHSEDMANVLLFLILLPGIIIHEGAHWLTARLFGLKTSRFRVWPKRRGKFLGLGSVSVQTAGIGIDSIVGLAPLIIGSLLIAIISHRIFNAASVTSAISVGRWQSLFDILINSARTADGALWGYLLFAIGNAMMPSASDREPVKPLILYVLLATVAYILIGLPLEPLRSIFFLVHPLLQSLNSAFFFIIIIDIAVLLGLLLIEIFTAPRSAVRTRR